MKSFTLETKKFIENFIWAVAAVASFFTLIGLLWQQEISNLSLSFGSKFIILIGLIILCLLYACFMTELKSSVTFIFNPQFRLTVEKGDLFTKRGIIVIPVNEYFDTQVGDGIISPSSIHGKWINRFFKEKTQELDQLIESELNETANKPGLRTEGKNKIYPLGTCIDIKLDFNIYVLLVLSHFDENNHAFLERKDFSIVLQKLFEHLQRLDLAVNSVYMPLIGTGLSRLGRSPQRILDYIVDEIDFKYSDLNFPKGLFIEIYDISQVNLNQLENLEKK